MSTRDIATEEEIMILHNEPEDQDSSQLPWELDDETVK